MTKNIQISERMFNDMLKLIMFLEAGRNDELVDKLSNDVWTQIDDKIDRMKNRELYTQSKTAASPSEREKARQEYFKRVGIHMD